MNMSSSPVAHIGILVSDVERARRHWTKVMGVPFSPIVRYRSTAWSGLADPVPHANDLRQIVFFGTDPSIEIQEFVDNGSHAASRGEGGHHFAFPPVEDNNARHDELARLGIGMDGGASHEGRWIIQFSEAAALNNVSTEWVEESPGHMDLKDDGSPVDRLPDGAATVFDVDTVVAAAGNRPKSGMTEFGVRVADLDAAIAPWGAVTGYRFEVEASAGGERSAVSRGVMPAVRLVEASRASEREGLFYALVETGDLDGTRARLDRDGVPLAQAHGGSRGEFAIDPAYLNGFSIRFAQATA